jgi:anti-sigma B factor antagonist
LGENVAEFSNSDGIMTIRLTEPRLDAARAPALKAAFNDNIVDKPERIIVEASGLEFMDSTGLGVVVSLLKMMGPNGKLALVGAQPAVQKLLKITKLDQIVRPYASRDEAVAALGR